MRLACWRSRPRDHGLFTKDCFGETPKTARETRALPGEAGAPSGRMRALSLIPVARRDLGKFFPTQTQPIVPGLSHAIARGEIALVELVAFEDLCESGFHRQLVTVEDGIGGPDCGGMMRVACRRHGQVAQLRITEGERVVAAQRGSGIENLQRIDR